MKLGHYEVGERVGAGAMGTVFRATAPSGDVVAIKLLRRELTKPGAREQFDRERRLQQQLGLNEGFVPLHGSGESSSGPYLVMTFLEGGSLRERLARGPLAVDETVALGVSLARAAGQAHARGIVHRDLKPENVLFTAEGRPLIADLGIAKHFKDGPGATNSVSLTQDGVMKGTVGYMAPEQMNDARAAGPPADVYSLALILYECLAGRPAYLGPTLIELLVRMSKGPPEPLSRVAPSVASWLSTVLEGALARDPALGPRTGEELARLLERRDAPPASPRRTGRIAVALGVGGGVAVCGAVAALALFAGSPALSAGPPAPPDVEVAPSLPVPARGTAPADRSGLRRDVEGLARQIERGDFATASTHVARARAMRAVHGDLDVTPVTSAGVDRLLDRLRRISSLKGKFLFRDTPGAGALWLELIELAPDLQPPPALHDAVFEPVVEARITLASTEVALASFDVGTASGRFSGRFWASWIERHLRAVGLERARRLVGRALGRTPGAVYLMALRGKVLLAGDEACAPAPTEALRVLEGAERGATDADAFDVRYWLALARWEVSGPEVALRSLPPAPGLAPETAIELGPVRMLVHCEALRAHLLRVTRGAGQDASVLARFAKGDLSAHEAVAGEFAAHGALLDAARLKDPSARGAIAASLGE